jgi:cystathionine beta-lyase/cystathionine gamma-synthase
MSYFELGDAELEEIGIHPALIRLSVGIEDGPELERDLLRALEG